MGITTDNDKFPKIAVIPMFWDRLGSKSYEFMT